MTGSPSASLAAPAAAAIAAGFDRYEQAFREVTRRARRRFERRDWMGGQLDAAERLDLYRRVLDEVVAQIRALLGPALKDRELWAAMKAAYSPLGAARADVELAETFFNSVTRRIFATVGVDPAIEFVGSDFAELALQDPPGAEPVFRSYIAAAGLRTIVRTILNDFRFAVPCEDFERDVELVAGAIEVQLTEAWGDARHEAIELVRAPFYRNKAAYLIGRIRRDGRSLPLILPLLNGAQGVFADTVLLSEDEASIVFSFTRSYFHVEVERPGALVAFLKTLMPLKRLAELYIAIGYHKHGKTELYRDLLAHLARSDDCFEIARGEKGLVMVVFTMPTYDVAFKIIRDTFAHPKRTTRAAVMNRYQLVFRHDRAGRLVDAQEFEHLEFDRERFAPRLLDELLRVAAATVRVDGERVIVRHLYTERRVTPLNVYLREADPEAAREAVIDYGRAIKDLAASNIFPGDLLLKNFGVTRHGRVVFYDYDELCLLTECNFRALPQARHPDDELQSEPWFYVGPSDVFPEEFGRFLGLPEEQAAVFLERHGDLLGVEFWQEMQARHQAGEIVDLFPYPQRKRFRPQALGTADERG
jgi:isocitrate dehydrogenase kinase/phosphatase